MDSTKEEGYIFTDVSSNSENNRDEFNNIGGDKSNQNLDPVNNESIWKLVFTSYEEARAFYIEYGRKKGFDVRKCHRKTKHGIVKNVQLVCSREGFRKPPIQGREPRRRSKDETRCGCKALFRVAHDISDGFYMVTNFVPEHNHPLETPSTAHYLKCNRYMSPAEKPLLSGLRDSGMRTCKSLDLLEYMEGGPGRLSFTRKDGYNYLTKQKMELTKYGDVNNAISLLEGMKIKDENFIFEYTTDDNDSSLTRLFWTDGFSKAQYRLFGDVLQFDSTYKMNTYQFPLVILSGVDNHRRTCVFRAALMCNESVESYIWLLKKFREVMGDEDPISILTDQDPAMRHAIEKEFPDSIHRLCSWHLQRNCMQRTRMPKFVSSFAEFLKNNISIEEFEMKWSKLIDEYDLSEHPWVVETYGKREKWSETHFSGHFVGLMRSTQRAESLNSRIKELGGIFAFKVTEFLKHFQELLDKMRANFVMDQQSSERRNSTLMRTTLVHLQKHAASVYTKRVFRLVENENFEAQGLVVEESTNHEGILFGFTFVKYGVSAPKRRFVQIDWIQGKFECDCLMLESVGLPCCHLFCAFKCLQLTEIPTPCICERWTVDIGIDLRLNFRPVFPFEDPQRSRFMQIYKESIDFSLQGSQSEYAKAKSLKLLRAAAKEVASDSISSSKSVERNEEHVACHGFRDPVTSHSHVGVQDPRKIKSRGAPRAKRQRCSACRELGHKSSTCKKNSDRIVGDGGQPQFGASEEHNKSEEDDNNEIHNQHDTQAS